MWGNELAGKFNERALRSFIVALFASFKWPRLMSVCLGVYIFTHRDLSLYIRKQVYVYMSPNLGSYDTGAPFANNVVKKSQMAANYYGHAIIGPKVVGLLGL